MLGIPLLENRKGLRFLGFLEISKIQTNDRPEIQRFHAHPQLFINIQKLFKHMFDLISFTYVLGFSTIIQDLLRFHHRIFRFYFKRSEIPIVFDPPELLNEIDKYLPKT